MFLGVEVFKMFASTNHIKEKLQRKMAKKDGKERWQRKMAKKDCFSSQRPKFYRTNHIFDKRSFLCSGMKFLKKFSSVFRAKGIWGITRELKISLRP
jgi:CRISPR/Cas system CSM-associated protein Csm5 (group 7 of RAMP superfamily)